MENNYKAVDYRKVFSEIRKRKKLYLITLSITLVVSSLYIICIPREYTSSTEMAPETEGPTTGSTSALGSLASTFGLDLSNMQSTDAITPLLYPDLMKDNGFVASFFSVKVQTQDGKIKTDYYTYLKKYQKMPWWTRAFGGLQGLFKHRQPTGPSRKFDPYHPTKEQDGIIEHIRNDISLTVDKKTGSISIQITSQDPLICKTLADSARERLQQFITNYRTEKARKDLDYYKKLTADAKAKYEQERQLYGSYSDANADLILQSYKSKQEDIENEMQLRYNTYSTLNTQLQAAMAKVQERTPAFTLIQGATVPVKPDKPKRMTFVLTMLILAFLGTSIYVLRDIILPKK